MPETRNHPVILANGDIDSIDITPGVKDPDWGQPVTEISAPQGIWVITHGKDVGYNVQQQWNPSGEPGDSAWRYRISTDTLDEAITYIVGCVETMTDDSHHAACRAHHDRRLAEAAKLGLRAPRR